MNEQAQDALSKPLPHDVVKTRVQAGQTLSYVEGWFVLQTANEVFGFGGWDVQVVSTAVLFSGERNGKYQHVARTHARVRVGDVTRDGIGVGVGTANDPGAAIELAEKASETDAVKRAFRTFGNRFGLCLYDKEQEGVGASRAAAAHLEAISKLSTLAAVDAYAAANTPAFRALSPADSADIRNALAEARQRCAAAAPTTPPAPATPKRDWLKEIAACKKRGELLSLCTAIAAANLNGSRDAVLSTLAARLRAATERMDQHSRTEFVQAYVELLPVEFRDAVGFGLDSEGA